VSVPVSLCGNFYVLCGVVLVYGLHAVSVVFTRSPNPWLMLSMV
jgi:hypothetical protein